MSVFTTMLTYGPADFYNEFPFKHFSHSYICLRNCLQGGHTVNILTAFRNDAVKKNDCLYCIVQVSFTAGD